MSKATVDVRNLSSASMCNDQSSPASFYAGKECAEVFPLFNMDAMATKWCSPIRSLIFELLVLRVDTSKQPIPDIDVLQNQ